MALPQIGEVHDGYRYEGGDPNAKASWSWAGESAAGGSGVINGFDSAQASAAYRKKIAEGRAAADMRRIEGIQALETAAYDNEANAEAAAAVLPNAPTGLAADFRIGLGKAMGGSPLGGRFGIPDTQQTADLETVRRLGNQGTLGSVGQLKGPLSDRDVQFLKTLQYDAGASPEQNRRVLEAQRWVSHRQAAYAAALRKWTENLGSPSALNAQGVGFDRWWGGYAARELPPPGTKPLQSRAAGAPKPSPTANAPRVQNDPFPGIKEGDRVQQGGVTYQRRGNQMVAVR